MLDWVKIANVAIEHGGRRTVAMIAGVWLLPKTHHYAYSTQRVTVSIMVAAPLRIGHRSKIDGEAEWRCS
jgi:hypothetical protein